jgi:hypothetical protein
VFQKLKENKLYGKVEKCEFGVTEVDFLGHKITQEGLKMDDHKVKANLDWETPRLVSALRLFLGLASYYCKFIKNFAKIASPLTNLLKKSFGTYEWDEACNEAFETLKGILVKVPMLKFDAPPSSLCDPKGSKELDLRNWSETWCRSQLPALKGIEGSCWKLRD